MMRFYNTYYKFEDSVEFLRLELAQFSASSSPGFPRSRTALTILRSILVPSCHILRCRASNTGGNASPVFSYRPAMANPNPSFFFATLRLSLN